MRLEMYDFVVWYPSDGPGTRMSAWPSESELQGFFADLPPFATVSTDAPLANHSITAVNVLLPHPGAFPSTLDGLATSLAKRGIVTLSPVLPSDPNAVIVSGGVPDADDVVRARRAIDIGLDATLILGGKRLTTSDYPRIVTGAGLNYSVVRRAGLPSVGLLSGANPTDPLDASSPVLSVLVEDNPYGTPEMHIDHAEKSGVATVVLLATDLSAGEVIGLCSLDQGWLHDGVSPLVREAIARLTGGCAASSDQIAATYDAVAEAIDASLLGDCVFPPLDTLETLANTCSR